jgi:Ca2+-binding EF-hand superfamily protein
MTTRHRFFLTALALGTSLLARAESSPAHAASSRGVSPLLAALDLDHDGTLSAREVAAAPVLLAALDLNGDGKISADERQALAAGSRSGRAWRGPTTFNLVLTLDANSDGDIQSMEIANAVLSLQRLDLNGDGRLAPNELRPAMMAQNRSGRTESSSAGS